MSGMQQSKNGKAIAQNPHEDEITETKNRDEAAPLPEQVLMQDLPDEDLPWGAERTPDGTIMVSEEYIYPFERIVDMMNVHYPKDIKTVFCQEVLKSYDTISCESFHQRKRNLYWVAEINEHYRKIAKDKEELANEKANLGMNAAGTPVDAWAHVPRGSASRSRRGSISTVRTNATRSRDKQWKCCKCNRNNKLELEKCKSSKHPHCNRHKRCGECSDVEATHEVDIGTPVEEEKHYPYIRKHEQD